jgi:uncharacterized protein (TIGR01777 family)
MNRRIVIPGGSGRVGCVLARYFHGLGDDVIVLSRKPRAESWQVIQWDGRSLGRWAERLNGADVVINLTGRDVDCRYTKANRREIMESRVCATQVIGKAIAQARQPPRLWMNASTATIYRHAQDRDMDEVTGEPGGNEKDAPSTWRFSIDVAKAWERTFFETVTPGTPKIALRSAMTMSPDHGGVLDILLQLVRFGAGGAIGGGEQFVSWVHEEDFLRAIEFLVARRDMDGCVNVCSPNPLPNYKFMRDLRRAAGIRVGVPTSKWMLEIGAFFLRTETELVLKSRRVIPRRLLEAGFEFVFPDWPCAAQDLVSQWRERRKFLHLVH